VREVAGEKADVVSAENFSYFIFRTRDALRTYFEAARQNLADEGLFVIDIMGGSETVEEDHKEERKLDGFRYVWEQHRVDPITAHATFFIHFRFRDGSELHRAFRYDWRLWTIPEVRELLLEAGFSRVDVYWEGTDEDGDGDGIYRKRKHAESDPSWIAYIVGVKQSEVAG
jgi:cyclopropane fatty-acyl-phospholipid synthase-like methyltransferase